MSRGNAKADVFHDDRDYQAFTDLVRRAIKHQRIRVLAWCFMPNHFHFVLRPYEDGDLSRWMHWLLTTHVQRYRLRYESVGRIWQGRFKAPPVQTDRHLLTVMRYVERNPLRAGLVARAEEWRWSSLRTRLGGNGFLLHPSPVKLPRNWRQFVNEPIDAKELESVRDSLRRGRPYGDDVWTIGTAERLGLLSTLRPRGRPRVIEERTPRRE